MRRIRTIAHGKRSVVFFLSLLALNSRGQKEKVKVTLLLPAEEEGGGGREHPTGVCTHTVYSGLGQHHDAACPPTPPPHTQKACHPAPAGATKTQRPLFPDYESPCPHSSIYTLSWNDLFIRLVDPAWVQSRPVGRRAGGGDKCMHAWSLCHSHSLFGYPERWALCG